MYVCVLDSFVYVIVCLRVRFFACICVGLIVCSCGRLCVYLFIDINVCFFCGLDCLFVRPFV